MNGEIKRILYNLIGEGKIPYILHVLHIVEVNALQVHIRNLQDILLVLLTHHNIGDTGTLSGQNLLLNTTHGQHFSAQGNLTSHSGVLTHLTLGEGRGDRSGDGDTCRRTVLRCSTLGYMNVDVPVVEHTVVDVERLGMGLYVLNSQDGRLLHHIAQVTGKRELRALAL